MKNAILLSFLFIALATLSARADIRAELDALLAEDPITEPSVAKLCDMGDSTSRQNLQQLCYKTACAGFAYLGATNLYEETMAKVITKSFAESFQVQCPRCRGLSVAKVVCPDCNGKGCPSCNETGRVKSRCPDCDGKAAVFSHDSALSGYRRGLRAIINLSDPPTELPSAPKPPDFNRPHVPLTKTTVPQTEPPIPQELSSKPRLTDDQFFIRHCLDQAAYAVYTNRASTTIQKQEAFQKIAPRAYVPRGDHFPILIGRYPNGESFEVADVSEKGDVFLVKLRKNSKDFFHHTLIIPKSESEVALWNKGRAVTSRDWVFVTKVFQLSLEPQTSKTFYRTLAEFRRLHPGAEDIESP